MPRNKPKANILGGSLIKAHKRRNKNINNSDFRHTSELPDGRNCTLLNLHSVTEQTNIEEFTEIAFAAENKFNSDFSKIKIVDPDEYDQIPNEEEMAAIHEENKEILCIPRRPPWDLNLMSKEEIDKNEIDAFHKWRRKLSEVLEKKKIKITPFEKNLEVWRQLWRVLERSDVVIQILDARNPLLYRCLDLEAYVKEIDDKKINILLLNKADLLNESQRKCWCDYFDEMGMKVIFFSALLEGERPEEDFVIPQLKEDVEGKIINQQKNSPDVLSREELLEFFRQTCKANNVVQSSVHIPTIGLVGYPNVGKSSTLNALLKAKKTCVSATPGKTKHFQTFIVSQDLCLCDCPGLVFLNFVSTKAELIINGILPIDHLTDWKKPATLITNKIPRKVLESTYSILISSCGVGRSPTAEEFLDAFGYSRGFMTHRGLPDNARSARIILKDYNSGKLLFCHAPPDVKQEEYHEFPEIKSKKPARKGNASEEIYEDPCEQSFDRKYFAELHIRNSKQNVPSNTTGKPHKKHNNRNKKEKLRRVYRACDN